MPSGQEGLQQIDAAKGILLGPLGPDAAKRADDLTWASKVEIVGLIAEIKRLDGEIRELRDRLQAFSRPTEVRAASGGPSSTSARAALLRQSGCT